MELSKLTKLSLRTIWKHEALDFTNWLAKDENLELLGETLGLSIINPETEVGVGQFHVDILAENDKGQKVVIENQLEPTNHEHLGKLVTYASGHDAKIIVWVVSKAREEHEQAINWLNENTTEDANFFLIEIEVWKIGDSPPAPRFNIIAKPNDWAKTIKQSGIVNNVTDLKLKQKAFWEKLKEYGEKNSANVKNWQKALAQHWYNVSIGTSKANIAATINSRENVVGVELYINNNKDLFYSIESKKDEIESQIGSALEWMELPEGKASRIKISYPGNFQNPKDEPKLIEWLCNTIDQFAKVLPKYLTK